MSGCACVCVSACRVSAGLTTSLGPTVEAKQAELKRKKLSYYDPTIGVMEAQSRWDKLMAAEEVTQEELKMALFKGERDRERRGKEREGGREGREGRVGGKWVR